TGQPVPWRSSLRPEAPLLPVISIHIPDPLLEDVDARAQELGLSRSIRAEGLGADEFRRGD
ncbi:MAG: ribbon-helix-helix protein, CopG family, partial [Proteobacteria bacterium]|nr:ribbon-helix-helix protein, CopG family [Pseudomonadota bacterium]